jgi:hypothetical protein
VAILPAQAEAWPWKIFPIPTATSYRPLRLILHPPRTYLVPTPRRPASARAPDGPRPIGPMPLEVELDDPLDRCQGRVVRPDGETSTVGVCNRLAGSPAAGGRRCLEDRRRSVLRRRPGIKAGARRLADDLWLGLADRMPSHRRTLFLALSFGSSPPSDRRGRARSAEMRRGPGRLRLASGIPPIGTTFAGHG